MNQFFFFLFFTTSRRVGSGFLEWEMIFGGAKMHGTCGKDVTILPRWWLKQWSWWWRLLWTGSSGTGWRLRLEAKETWRTWEKNKGQEEVFLVAGVISKGLTERDVGLKGKGDRKKKKRKPVGKKGELRLGEAKK